MSYIPPLGFVPASILAQACSCDGKAFPNFVALSTLIADYVRSNVPLRLELLSPVDDQFISGLDPMLMVNRGEHGHQHSSLTPSQEVDAATLILLIIDVIVTYGDTSEESTIRFIRSIIDSDLMREPMLAILRARISDTGELDDGVIPDCPGKSFIEDWSNRRIALWAPPGAAQAP